MADNISSNNPNIHPDNSILTDLSSSLGTEALSPQQRDGISILKEIPRLVSQVENLKVDGTTLAFTVATGTPPALEEADAKLFKKLGDSFLASSGRKASANTDRSTQVQAGAEKTESAQAEAAAGQDLAKEIMKDGKIDLAALFSHIEDMIKGQMVQNNKDDLLNNMSRKRHLNEARIKKIEENIQKMKEGKKAGALQKAFMWTGIALAVAGLAIAAAFSGGSTAALIAIVIVTATTVALDSTGTTDKMIKGLADAMGGSMGAQIAAMIMIMALYIGASLAAGNAGGAVKAGARLVGRGAQTGAQAASTGAKAAQTGEKLSRFQRLQQMLRDPKVHTMARRAEAGSTMAEGTVQAGEGVTAGVAADIYKDIGLNEADMKKMLAQQQMLEALIERNMEQFKKLAEVLQSMAGKAMAIMNDNQETTVDVIRQLSGQPGTASGA